MAEDLDAFLTSLESKLRGPYSSLELARIISTNSLRGGLTAKQYLQSISQVLSRTDKNTYLRTIVGLLALEPDKETDMEIYKILTVAQQPEKEEWVRVVAGLARGILFVEDDEDTRESCRGEEASSMLQKTCQEILDQTRQLERDTEAKASSSSNNKNKDKDNSLQTTDTYPLFVSYRYSLLDPKLLDLVIPEHKDNPYFQCDETAEILKVDDDLETAKALESQDHAIFDTTAKVVASKAEETAKQPDQKPVAVLPGGNRNTTVKKTTAPDPRRQPSFFMPTKRPNVTAGRGVGRPIPTKGTLHTRKAGAAQALLEKNRRVQGLAAPGAARAAQMGRAQKLANAKSKMKLIDVTEVRGLNNAHQKRDDKLAKRQTAEQKMLARKRKIMEAAAEKGLVAAPKLQKLEEEAKGDQSSEDDDNGQPDPMDMINSNTGNGFMAFGNDDDDDDDDENHNNNNGNNNNDNSNEEWQTILEKRSNKLSDEDRIRVQQFYTNQHNPTPDMPVYKMKLHEERTTDPATGQALKETFYLELDYSTFTSKQSKKIKRY